VRTIDPAGVGDDLSSSGKEGVQGSAARFKIVGG
jgi:hypothetical protein